MLQVLQVGAPPGKRREEGPVPPTSLRKDEDEFYTKGNKKIKPLSKNKKCSGRREGNRGKGGSRDLMSGSWFRCKRFLYV